MRHVIWVGLAWFATVVATAVAAELSVAHLLPEVVVIVAAFLALRREGAALVACCIAMGFLVGRAAGAPVGLHALALSMTALGIHLVVGSITTGGRGFFAVVVLVATAAYHALLYLLLWAFRGEVSFPSWTSALLFPNAMLTAVLALVAFPVLEALEARVSPQQREVLSFR